MGLTRDYLDYFEAQWAPFFPQLAGRRMLELGDQVIGLGHGQPLETGKAYFERQGLVHVSLDLNAQNGSLPYDLTLPIDPLDLGGPFDILTNAGTTEHVEPFLGQITCFENLHRLLKVGGVALHIVPDEADLRGEQRWKKHCNNYYSDAFFARFAHENGYELIDSRLVRGLRFACLHKCEDRPFMGAPERLLAEITRRSGGQVYRGINDSTRHQPLVHQLREGWRSIRDWSRQCRARLGLRAARRAAIVPATPLNARKAG